MNFIKKQTVFGWVTLASAVISLVALIVYIVTSTTGFMAGRALPAGTIVLTLFAIIALAVTPIFADKLDHRIVGGILFVVVVLLAIGLCLFINERVQLFADVYFIPVNYPEAEGAALSASIVGIVFYLLAIVATIVAGFSGQLNKQVD